MADKKELINKITPLVENTLMRYGFIPVEIDFARENDRDILRIFIYSKTKPVTLDDCEKISRSLDEFLDELIDFKYSLEVSSPGLSRKLKSEKEYLIFIGKIVSIKTKTNDIFPNYKVEGKILDYNEESGVLIEEVETKNEYRIKINDIKSSNLVFK